MLAASLYADFFGVGSVCGIGYWGLRFLVFDVQVGLSAGVSF